MSDFQIGGVKFQGSYRNVFKCTAKYNGDVFAMARLEKNKHCQPQSAKRDRDILSAINHPNVVPLHWSFELDNDWVLIMGFCNLGTLRQHIDKNGEPGLTDEETKVYCNDILDGLEHLHANFILHRDICPANIGLCKSMQSVTAKIVDCGFAKRDRSGVIVGSDGYRAPEITLEKRRTGAFRKAAKSFDTTVDFYSFGVLLFVMLVGNEAKSSEGHAWTHEEFQEMLEDPEHSLWHCDIYLETGIFGSSQLPDMEDSGAIDTIAALTETDPKCRPQTAMDIRDLVFFTDEGDASED
jgi:serine/threonine protein kinase